MPNVVHFDIPADDIERAKNFYSQLFGWKIENTSMPGGDYTVIYKHEKEKPGIGGGIIKRSASMNMPINYVSVPSVDEFVKKAEGLGAEIIMKKHSVEGVGSFSLCKDTEGNLFGLHEHE